MELKQMMRLSAKSVYLLFLLLSIACAGAQKTVKPEDRISLQEGGPHSGSWQSRTVSLDYQYYKQSDEIRLSVREKVITKARHTGFEAWVQFVDAQGKVLEEKSLASGENTFNIPPGTISLAFRSFLEPAVYKPPMSR